METPPERHSAQGLNVWPNSTDDNLSHWHHKQRPNTPTYCIHNGGPRGYLGRQSENHPGRGRSPDRERRASAHQERIRGRRRLTVGSMLRPDKEARYAVNLDRPSWWDSNVWQHLRSFRKRLFDAIDVEDMKLDGEWIELAADWAFMVPIVEMAASPRHIPGAAVPVPARRGQRRGRQAEEGCRCRPHPPPAGLPEASAAGKVTRRQRRSRALKAD